MIKFLDARITPDKSGFVLEVEREIEEHVRENNKLVKTGNKVMKWIFVSYPSSIPNAIESYIRYKNREMMEIKEYDSLESFKTDMKELVEKIINSIEKE